MASRSILHRWKGIEGPFAAPSLRSAVRLAVRASSRPRERKSEPALTRDILDRQIGTWATDRLTDTRDLAILLFAFASGGRRCSEVAQLRAEQRRDEPLAPRSARCEIATLPCLAIQFGRTKTGGAGDEGGVLLVGPPLEALRERLERAEIKRGPICRAHDSARGI